MLSFFCQDCIVAHKIYFCILQLEFVFDIEITEKLIHYVYQPTKVCGGDEFIRVLGVVKMESVLYPTAQSLVIENAKSYFEHVLYNEYDMSCQNQVQRRLGCADTRVSCVAACDKVNECEREHAEYVALSKKRMKELSDKMETEMMYFRNLTALVTVQEASIVTHDVELEKLKLQRYIEETSADIVAQLGSTCREIFDVFIKQLFLTAFGAVIDYNELQLVAQHIAVLVNTMIQVRVLGYLLSRDQVLKMYVSLYPDGPVDFSLNPTYPPFHLFGETDFENFKL